MTITSIYFTISFDVKGVLSQITQKGPRNREFKMSDTKKFIELRDEIIRGTDNIARMRRDIHIVVQTVHHEILSKTNHLNDSRIIVVRFAGSFMDYEWEIRAEEVNMRTIDPSKNYRRCLYTYTKDSNSNKSNLPKSNSPATCNVQSVWESLPGFLYGVSKKVPGFSLLFEYLTLAARVF